MLETSPRPHLAPQPRPAACAQVLVQPEAVVAEATTSFADGVAAEASSVAGENNRGPRLQLGPSQYLLLESGVMQATEATVSMDNQGTTALFFEWVRVNPDQSVVTASKVRTAKNKELLTAQSAHFQLGQDAAESRFLCQSAQGVLLPGESKTIVFGFLSSTPGLFAETWSLRVNPEPEFVGSLSPKGGVVTVSLQGAAVTRDSNEHCRVPARERLIHDGTREDIEHMLTEVIREVRTPIREEAVRAAQELAFESVNADAGLNYTVPIYDACAALWAKARAARDHSVAAKEGADGEGGAVNDAIQEGVVGEGEGEAKVTGDALQQEGVTDVAGAVSSVLEEWNSDMQSIREVIDEIVVPDPPTPQEEEGGADLAEQGEKGKEVDGEQEEKDEEDDEDEDEDEDDLEPQPAPPPPPLHPMQILKNDLDMEWKVLYAGAAVRPLPFTDSLANAQLSAKLADLVADAAESSRQEAGLAEDEVVAPLPSPFRPFFLPDGQPASEGPAAWEAALDPESQTGTAEQQYRLAAHTKVASGLASIAQQFFDDALTLHEEASESDRTMSQSLASKASLRFSEDLSGRRVLAVLDMDVGPHMLPDPYRPSEYAVPDSPVPPTISDAAKLVKRMLKETPSVIILMTELTAPVPDFEDEAVPDLEALSIKSLVPLLSSLLQVPVSFCPAVADLGTILSVPDPPTVVLLEHLDADCLVPIPEPEPEVLSDDEEDRLPFLGEPEDDPALIPVPPPQRPDVGEELKPHVDVVVCDTIKSGLDRKRGLVALSAPAARRIAGPTLHKELVNASVLLAQPKRPMLAIVGGVTLAEEVKYIDRLLDIVDEIMFAGPIALAFLAALGHETGATLIEPALIPMARKLLSKYVGRSWSQTCTFLFTLTIPSPFLPPLQITPARRERVAAGGLCHGRRARGL